ncbi:MAG: pyruvate kinase [Clostridia bacterium]|nr:pyruvate kinase [Clostridia bacterium]
MDSATAGSSAFRRIRSGFPALDRVLDDIRLGDNVVWQVDDIADYRFFAERFAAQALADGFRVVYVRFGGHPPVAPDDPHIRLCRVDAHRGFEAFTAEVHRIVTREGRQAFYVFDCLTELTDEWCSDLMTGNFFRSTCPYLFELDTVAFFALQRGRHSYETIARIRETTQLLLELHNIDGTLYLHPLKVWERYSPAMFLPHRVDAGGDRIEPVTASAEAAALFSPRIPGAGGALQLDYWDRVFLEAEQALDIPPDDPAAGGWRRRLIRMLFGPESRIGGLAERFLSLPDLIGIQRREIGTGPIGGKAAGMLLARAILAADPSFDWSVRLERHDSFFVGSDVYYTYLVHNDCFRLRLRQNTDEGYFALADELRTRLEHGYFPSSLRDRFLSMLEYFGNSPIIVRSSSLLEDQFGNAFAGKYESVFCPNQGSPEERYRRFEDAVRRVYASTMNPDALAYRHKRGLQGKDEQMALLVQRVSGDRHGPLFFPLVAGMGNSSNLYVWDNRIDGSAGMTRLVFGLGTRSVDRVAGDYPRIVALDRPALFPASGRDRARFSQHEADVLDLESNTLRPMPVRDVLRLAPGIDVDLIGEEDREAAEAARTYRLPPESVPWILTFARLLTGTDFADLLRRMMKRIESVYEYPVDIEYAANPGPDGLLRVNLLQCRPLQTRSIGPAVQMPAPGEGLHTLFSIGSGFMGGNVALRLDVLVLVRPETYTALPERDRFTVAREIGRINAAVAREGLAAMLLGPGRWGTTTPSLGVPVRFGEISAMAALGEIAFESAGLMPELSYGSHFFQDLVESGIFYAAIFPQEPDPGGGPSYRPEEVDALPVWEPAAGLVTLPDVLRVLDLRGTGATLLSDIGAQECRLVLQPSV